MLHPRESFAGVQHSRLFADIHRNMPVLNMFLERYHVFCIFVKRNCSFKTFV